MFYTDPFEYILIEDCLPDNVFEGLLKEARDHVENAAEKRENPAVMTDLFPFINKAMFDKFSKVRQFAPKFAFKRIEWSVQPPGYQFKKHIDYGPKILTAVLYVSPKMNCGTILYDENENEIEVPWKPNSIFIHCPYEGTLHSYHNPSDKDYRVTIMCHIVDAKRLDPKKDGDVRKYFNTAISKLK